MSGCEAKAKTEVEIMWTNQHGTGPKTDDRVETQVILQFMCQAFPDEKFPNGKLPLNADVNREFEYHTIRNGQTLTTQGFANGVRQNAYITKDRGLHEPAAYYQAYYRRERNKGIVKGKLNTQKNKIKSTATPRTFSWPRRSIKVYSENA